MLLNYRQDIDGLRTIAVMLVVLFHVGFPISGGFVGVDIFFVISGFLITSLIQKQIGRDKFTFKGFYLHRMRRILPALITVMLATFLAGWFVLGAEDYTQSTRIAIYALFGFSNIYLYSKGSDYFAQDTDLIPFVHTWSLGAEEQFYFLAPFFFLILLKYVKNKVTTNIILFILLLIGTGLSHYMAYVNPSAAYYLLPARFFEMLLGGVLALNYQNIPISKSLLVNNLLGFIAITTIFVMSFVLTKQSIFPGINALIVCLASCVIIYLGKAEKKTFITKILSLKPFVFIGLISYSLYLWHWPIITFFNIVGIELDTIARLGLVVLFIILAYLTWRFVENPFRYKFKFGFLKTFILLVLIPAVFLIIFKDLAKNTNGFEEYRLSKEVIELSNSTKEDKDFKKRFCHGYVGYGKQVSTDKCYLGDKDAKLTTLYFGDSHANSYAGFLEELLIDANIRAYPLSDASTIYLKDIDYSKLGSRAITNEEAVRFVEEIKQELDKKDYDRVILTGYFNYHLKKHGVDNFEKWFINTVKQILDNKSKLYIIEDFYEIPKGKISCPVYNKMYNLNMDCSISIEAKNQYNKTLNNIYDKVKELYKEVVFIDPSKVTCDDKTCDVIVKDKLMFIDNHHIVYPASKEIGKLYLEKYENPFKI